MTATIVGPTTDLTPIDEAEFYTPPPCDGEFEGEDWKCPNAADYVLAATCCGGQVCLCESCFFIFIDYCKRHSGELFMCAMCNREIILHTKHMIFIGRV